MLKAAMPLKCSFSSRLKAQRAREGEKEGREIERKIERRELSCAITELKTKHSLVENIGKEKK